MSRLQHSLPGYRRSMQLSKETLYIFVEGRPDRYMYGQIIESECQGSEICYKIVAAEEVRDGEGGKAALLRLFDYLRRRSSLIDRFKCKTTISIFFLDKDVDDFLRTRRRSEHVVYTETYEFENYLFMHGDLSEAAAASASLDTRSIRTGLGDYTAWRQRAATKWKEWVKLCLFSRTRGIRSISNYGRLSKVNKELCGPVDAKKCGYYRSILQKKSGMRSEHFKCSFARLSRKVDTIYSRGQHDLIFKGTWYTYFLTEDIRRIAGSRHFNSHYLERRLLSSLAQTLNLDDPWTDHFRVPIRGLVAKAKI